MIQQQQHERACPTIQGVLKESAPTVAAGLANPSRRIRVTCRRCPSSSCGSGHNPADAGSRPDPTAREVCQHTIHGGKEASVDDPASADTSFAWMSEPEDAADDTYCYFNAATCPDCGSGLVRLGACFSCPSCGWGSCC